MRDVEPRHIAELLSPFESVDIAAVLNLLRTADEPMRLDSDPPASSADFELARRRLLDESV